jgi:hypothetical protein
MFPKNYDMHSSFLFIISLYISKALDTVKFCTSSSFLCIVSLLKNRTASKLCLHVDSNFKEVTEDGGIISKDPK